MVPEASGHECKGFRHGEYAIREMVVIFAPPRRIQETSLNSSGVSWSRDSFSRFARNTLLWKIRALRRERDFRTTLTIHVGKYLTGFSVMAPAMSQGLDTASTSSDVTHGPMTTRNA